VCLAIGVGIAGTCYFIVKLIPYALGAILGYMGGSLLFTMVLVYFPSINQTALFYSIVGISIIICIIILDRLKDMLNSILSSIMGAYFSVRVIIILNTFRLFPSSLEASQMRPTPVS